MKIVAKGLIENKSSLKWRHDGISDYQLTIVYSTVYSGADQRKHQRLQSYASLAFV